MSDGKKLSRLVTKKNDNGLRMTDKEEASLKVSSKKQRALVRDKDRLVKERTDLHVKLEEKIKARRKDKLGWYTPMYRIYTKYGCKREFSGRLLKVIKRESSLIFDGAKKLLRLHKDPPVDDPIVDELCDNIIDLLTDSCKVLHILHKASLPADNDVKNQEY